MKMKAKFVVRSESGGVRWKLQMTENLNRASRNQSGGVGFWKEASFSLSLFSRPRPLLETQTRAGDPALPAKLPSRKPIRRLSFSNRRKS
jgi:hypothetical protein